MAAQHTFDRRSTGGLLLLVICLLLAIPFTDFAVAGNVFRFVPLMLGAMAGYWMAMPAGSQPKVFWLVTIGLRLLVLPITPGDDIWRYLWEGKMQWHGFNPYLLQPDSPILQPLRDASWPSINHRDWAAIYPPGAELLLKALTFAGPSVWIMKFVFLLADLLVVFLLLRLNLGLSRHREAAWYAWNPLVVYSFSGAAHYDSLMLAPLLLAVYGLGRAIPPSGKPAHWGWAAFSAFLLGLAISIKLVPLVLLPIFALALRSRMLVMPLAAVVPWLTASYYGFPEKRIFETFREFSYVGRFNDFAWWISERLFWANPTQKNGVYTLVAGLVVGCVSLLAWRNWKRALLWVLGASLIFSTVVHPWYITWILPFAALQKARGWFVLSGSVFLAFLWWETTPWWQAWQPSPLLSLAISLPPIIFWVAGRFRGDKVAHGQR